MSTIKLKERYGHSNYTTSLVTPFLRPAKQFLLKPPLSSPFLLINTSRAAWCIRPRRSKFGNGLRGLKRHKMRKPIFLTRSHCPVRRLLAGAPQVLISGLYFRRQPSQQRYTSAS
jgi:hypothetical protein